MSEFLLCGIMNKDESLEPLDALLLAVIGIAIVFIVLIFLMLVVQLMGKSFEGANKFKETHPELLGKFKIKKKEQEEVEEKIDLEELAEGSCGDLVLVNTSERDAAMIMAIVADELKTPLYELHFKSIKKVEE